MGGKGKTPLEWAYEHSKNLKNAKEELMHTSVLTQINEYLLSLDNNRYKPGYWTILKNISLAYCINPFGVILKKYNINDTIFLDLFCGSGITPLKDTNTSNPKWIVGSPVISTQMTDHPFQKYYFGDINRKSIQLLNPILETLNKKSNMKINYEILSANDANENFNRIQKDLENKYVFAYIDPTGFQWNWRSMERLLRFKRFDILMNFQTREVDRIHTMDKIKKFFGPCASEIKICNNCDEKLDIYILTS